MKKLIWGIAAVIAVLALSVLDSGAGPAPDARAAGTITFVGIDVVTTGNDATHLNGNLTGAVNLATDVQTCIEVTNGSTFSIDVVLHGLPADPAPTVPGDKLAGVTYDIDYDPAIIQLGNDDDNDGKYDEDTQIDDGDEDSDTNSGEEGIDDPLSIGATIGHDPNFVLSGPTDFSKGNGFDGLSNPPSVPPGTGTWSDYHFTFFKFSGFPSAPRSGTLNRIDVTAVGNGVSTLNLRDYFGTGNAASPPTLGADAGGNFTIGNGSDGDAKIAVGVPCPALVLVQGNVDCSSASPQVSAVDALKVLRKVAGLSVTKSDPACPDLGTGASPVWGNVDCSVAVPEVNAVDALKILRKVAGLSVTQTEPPPCVDIGDPFP